MTAIHRTMFVTLLLVSVVAVTSCRTAQTTFEEAAVSGYRKMGITWSDGEKTQIFVRTLERNGQLALCSYAISGFKPGDGDAEKKMFAVNRLIVDGHDIGSAQFIPVYKRDAFAPFRANCVQTTVPWERGLARADISMDGPNRFVMSY